MIIKENAWGISEGNHVGRIRVMQDITSIHTPSRTRSRRFLKRTSRITVRRIKAFDTKPAERVSGNRDKEGRI
jgi:hypothetical protein